MEVVLASDATIKGHTRGPRKRPKMVGIGKSGFDSSSYAEFSQEHDQHLTLDVWWPNHE